MGSSIDICFVVTLPMACFEGEIALYEHLDGVILIRLFIISTYRNGLMKGVFLAYIRERLPKAYFEGEISHYEQPKRYCGLLPFVIGFEARRWLGLSDLCGRCSVRFAYLWC